MTPAVVTRSVCCQNKAVVSILWRSCADDDQLFTPSCQAGLSSRGRARFLRLLNVFTVLTLASRLNGSVCKQTLLLVPSGLRLMFDFYHEKEIIKKDEIIKKNNER